MPTTADSKTKPVSSPAPRRSRLIWGLGFVVLVGALWGGGSLWVERSVLSDIYDRERYQAAIDRLSTWRFLSFRPARWDWYKAEALRKLGEAARVKQYTDAASAAGVSSEMAHGPLWLLESSIGMTSSTREHLGPLLILYGPRRSEVYAALVQGFIAKGATSDAASTIRLWRDDLDSDPQLFYWDGILATTKYELNRAVAAFRKALEVKPDFVQARIELADVLLEQVQLDEARTEYEWLIKNAPPSNHIITSYARTLLNLGFADEAAAELTKLTGVEKLPSSELALIAETNLESGKTDVAMEQCQLLVTRWPKVVAYLELLARTEAKRGNQERSSELFVKANLSQNRRPEIDAMLGQLNTEPNNLNLRRNLGEMMMTFLDPASGAGYLQSVTRSDPNDVRAHVLLADYFRREGKLDKAAIHERVIRDRAQENPQIPVSNP